MIWGDQLLIILAAAVLKDEPGATIIADVKASQTLFDRIAEMGGKPLMWKTGHSLIKSKMKETGAPLAGEMSGHIFFKHQWYGFDDALYAAVRTIRAVSASGKSLTELKDEMPVSVATPELRFQVDESRKFAVIDEVAERLAAEGANVNSTDGVRVKHRRRLVAAARIEHPGRAGRPRRGEGPGRARPADGDGQRPAGRERHRRGRGRALAAFSPVKLAFVAVMSWLPSAHCAIIARRQAREGLRRRGADQ